MPIGVDETALVRVADATEQAAALVAMVRLNDLASGVAAAMPGSRSAEMAARLAQAVSDVAADLLRELTGHADALRRGAMSYADTEHGVSVAVCATRGAA